MSRVSISNIPTGVRKTGSVYGSQRVSAPPMNAFNGSIQLILGPMFSGKSTELVRIIRRYGIAGRKCLVIKYKNDTRYSDECLSTHDRQMIPAIALERLLPDALSFHVDDIDCIGIDEGQFFPDIVQFCEEMANRGKTVVVSALDGDFQRKPFGSILELVPKCEGVFKLTSVCTHCGADAAFSKRIVPGTQVEDIGGSDKYVAVCRPCYHLELDDLVPTHHKEATSTSDDEMMAGSTSPISVESP
eukprot:TRINITY_DN6910_c0_g1::TRINITY_DN6910_c0_g1_i1::g.13363::m.13363 TRINITY_DN6910_c0_g1::TRINITY_DN6910_c0_g1_i1::g.13363  ORF type:complete len:268 (+),score=34.48,sp/P04184/KITH_MOUSE/61.02/2e-64,TK/PF00265.13/1.4e-63,AAA_14/PF13173.1/0.0011,DBD_Tnp_Mut/PF03108.10/0.85,DBD_Tnp_Mut/PF03108.10/3.9e+02,DBD_Tnp_Mut/PF03108.10/5.1e+03,AAA_10/PF12846.2/0.26 TRINITY_DN6910_c0_g1_i1:71-805(+)